MRFLARFLNGFSVDFEELATTLKKIIHPVPVLSLVEGFLAGFLVWIFVSCSTQRQVTQLVEHTSIDTIYLSNIQYDSIYIYQDKFVDRTKDTLYIKDKSIEYRYKLLRDTVRITQRDSIPYEVTVTEVKEITRPLTWFDRLCRYSFFMLLGVLLFSIYRLTRKFI